MCGIVGMAGEVTRDHVKIFNDMLDVVQLRGRHSTGVVRVDRRGEYEWMKQVGTPNFLKDSIQYKEMTERGMLPQILIGHGRHKTVGDTDWASAHPFEVQDAKLVGVHNGTLTGYHGWKQHKVGMTDSEALFNRIVEEGVDETFEQAEGAFTCVWYDGEQKRLYFIRNDQRPLWFTYSKDKRVMFWASEPWMFGAVERRIDLWEGKNDSPYICMPTRTLFGFDINGNAAKNSTPFAMKEERKIEKKSRYVPPARSNTFGKGSTTTTTTTTTKSPSEDKGGEVANPFLPLLPNFLKEKLTSQGTTKSGTTQTSTKKSSTTSKSSSEQPKQLTHIKSSSTKKHSPVLPGLPGSPRTNRRKLSVVSDGALIVGSKDKTQPDADKIYSPHVGVDTRYIKQVDTEYVTDLRTGKEYDEYEFRKNTNGGMCCHCNGVITSVKEVAEIYSPDRFICTSCVAPLKPILELVQEA